MRVLGVDLGLKRIGLALSDERGLSVRMLETLHAKNQKELLECLTTLIRQYAVSHVVIGSPPVLNKNSQTIAIRAQSLKNALETWATAKHSKIRVHILDESFSSKKAMDRLVKSGVSQKMRKKKLDSASAAILVEEFLSLYNTRD